MTLAEAQVILAHNYGKSQPGTVPWKLFEEAAKVLEDEYKRITEKEEP